MAKINLRPTIKQDVTYKLLTKDKNINYILFGGGAGGGKSWLGAEWLLTMSYLFPGTRWFIGRKQLKRLMGSTYLTFLKVCKHHGIPESDWKLNGQFNYIEFTNGSRIDLLDLAYMPSDPLYERFGSLEFTGGWIEEAGEVEYMCFEVLKTRIGRHRNDEYGLFPAKMLMTCNPTHNWLYRSFYKPWKTKSLPSTHAFVRSLYGDNPYTAEHYGQQLDALDDPILRARLRDGLWEYDADNLAIINFDAIVETFSNQVDVSANRYITADIARYGGDKIVIGVWQGLNLYKVQTFQQQSLAKTKEHIRDLMVDERVPYSRTLVDEDGVGGGIVDELEGIHGFMGGRSPIMKAQDDVDEMNERYANVPASYLKRQNYKNLRSQCYFMLANHINTHKLAITAELDEPTKEMLIEELQQVKRVDTAADAPLQIAPKEDAKEALGRSPDYADMLMMRMYFEIVKENKMPKYNAPDKEKLFEMGVPTQWGGIDAYGLDTFGLQR